VKFFLKAWFALVILGLALSGGLALTVYSAQAQMRTQWVMQDCYTLDDVTALLNRLPADRAVDAKVLAINSQRSFLGAASTPYYVWYRK